MDRTLAYLLTMLWGAVPALGAFFCLGPYRRRRLRSAGLKSPAAREAALALFWMFCGGMVMVALLPRWVVWSISDLLHGCPWNSGGYPFFEAGTVNLIPFQTFAPDARSLYNLAGNVVMFLPFGAVSALVWRGFTWRRALALGLFVTGFIEVWQLFVGRAFDIDDLMLNTLGVVCGYWLLRWLGRAAPALVNRFQVEPNPF